MYQLTWLSPRMHPRRTANSKSSKTGDWTTTTAPCATLLSNTLERIQCQGYFMPTSELCWGLLTFPVTGENKPADATEMQQCIPSHFQPRSFPKTERHGPDHTPSLFSCPGLSGHIGGVQRFLATRTVWCVGWRVRQAAHPAAVLPHTIVQLLSLQQRTLEHWRCYWTASNLQ